MQHYALRVTSGQQWSSPLWISIDVPAVPPPPVPSGLSAKALSGQIALAWEGGDRSGLLYDVYRAKAGTQDFVKRTREPVPIPSYSDLAAEPGTTYAYMVRAIDRRGQQSEASLPVEAAALPEIEQPVFATDFTAAPAAGLHDGTPLKGRLHGGAKIEGGVLLLGDKGFATFEHRPEFDLGPAISVQCSRPAPSYQVLGCMTDVKIYARALTPDEVAAAAKVRPDH